MRKIIAVLISLVLVLTLGITAFAAETTGEGTTTIDVYARYVRDIEGEYTAPAEDSKATVNLPNGSAITVTGAPQEVRTLVVIPIFESEKEAWEWLVGCLTDTGTLVRVYDIYFLDADGNRFNADGAVVAITAPSADGTLIACSVDTDGTGKALDFAANAGKIIFTTNGSRYYVLTEKAGASQPDDPENPSVPENPATRGNPSTPGDLLTRGNPSTPQLSNTSDSLKTGDNSNIRLLSVIMLLACGGVIGCILFGRKKKQQSLMK